MRYLKPHRTRHTYGWWLKTEKKIPIEERAFLMRHESINTTKTYSRQCVHLLGRVKGCGW